MIKLRKERDNSDLRKTIVYSTASGILASIYTNLGGGTFLVKYVLELGAKPFHLGLMTSIVQLSQVFQALGVFVLQIFKSRKKSVMWIIGFSRTAPFLFGMLPFLLPKPAALFVALFILAITTATQASAANIWTGWIADMIPLRIRGRFFSMRNRYLMLAGMIVGYIFSTFYDLFDPNGGAIAERIKAWLGNPSFFAPENEFYALAIIFFVAVLVNILWLFVIKHQPDSPPVNNKHPFFRTLKEPLRDSNFRRLALYSIWWMFAVGIASPFWAPFMMRTLRMSLLEIQVYGTISAITSFFTLRFWGHFIDRFGNKTAMRLVIIFGGINPLVWLFATPRNYWMLFVEAASSGFMWAGANIVAQNFVLAIAPEEKKQVYSGVFAAISGLAMTTSAFLSGVFLPKPMNFFGYHLYPEQVLFLITGLARWSAQIPLSWVYEARALPLGVALYKVTRGPKRLRWLNIIMYRVFKNSIENHINGNGNSQGNSQ